MAKRTTGRKQDFPEEQEPLRVQFILPKKTLTKLEVFTAQSDLSRNQNVNAAILKFIEEEEKKNPV